MEWKQQYSSLCAHEDLLECKQQPKKFSLSDVPLAKQQTKHNSLGEEKARAEITKHENKNLLIQERHWIELETTA